jgi:hypothetical protein
MLLAAGECSHRDRKPDGVNTAIHAGIARRVYGDNYETHEKR